MGALADRLQNTKPQQEPDTIGALRTWVERDNRRVPTEYSGLEQIEQADTQKLDYAPSIQEMHSDEARSDEAHGNSESGPKTSNALASNHYELRGFRLSEHQNAANREGGCDPPRIADLLKTDSAVSFEFHSTPSSLDVHYNNASQSHIQDTSSVHVHDHQFSTDAPLGLPSAPHSTPQRPLRSKSSVIGRAMATVARGVIVIAVGIFAIAALSEAGPKVKATASSALEASKLTPQPPRQSLELQQQLQGITEQVASLRNTVEQFGLRQQKMEEQLNSLKSSQDALKQSVNGLAQNAQSSNRRFRWRR